MGQALIPVAGSSPTFGIDFCKVAHVSSVQPSVSWSRNQILPQSHPFSIQTGPVCCPCSTWCCLSFHPGAHRRSCNCPSSCLPFVQSKFDPFFSCGSSDSPESQSQFSAQDRPCWSSVDCKKDPVDALPQHSEIESVSSLNLLIPTPLEAVSSLRRKRRKKL